MKYAVIVAGLIVALATGALAQAGSTLEQELAGNVKQLVLARQNRDVAYFQRTLTDDYLYVTATGSTQDKSDVLQDARVESKESQPPQLYDLKVIFLNADAAVVTYNTVDPADQPRYQHLSTVWTRQDGRWRLKFQQSTPNLWSLEDK